MSLRKPLSYAYTPETFTDVYSTIPQKLEEYARIQPDKEAFVIYGQDGQRHSITCVDLYRKSAAFARGLKNLGVVKGDIIGISLPNSIQWLIATFGSQIAGAVAMCLDMFERDGSDMISIFQEAGKCKAVITDVGEDCQKRDIYRSIFDTFPDGGFLPPDFVIYTDAEILNNNEMDFNSILENRNNVFYNDEFPEITYSDIALILLTSGTTGTPKLVQLSHKYILVSGYHVGSIMKLSSDDILYIPSSLAWVGGFCAAFLYNGNTRVTCHRRLLTSQKDLITFTTTLLQKERCAAAILLPQLLLKMVDSQKDEGFKKLRVIATSGLPVPAKCSNVVGRFADTFVNGYGSSELHYMMYMSVSSPDNFESFLVGRPVEGAEVKVVDGEGHTVHAGDLGEVYVRKLGLFSGYRNDSDKTRACFTTDGWYKTDDKGYMKNDGNFVITGRNSELFKCSNDLIDYLISPHAVEDYVRDLVHGIEELGVVSVKNEYQIQKVCICIVSKQGTTLRKEDIMMQLDSTSLKGAELVDIEIIFLDKLPRLSSGKLSRKQLAKQATDMIYQQIN